MLADEVEGARVVGAGEGEVEQALALHRRVRHPLRSQPVHLHHIFPGLGVQDLHTIGPELAITVPRKRGDQALVVVGHKLFHLGGSEGREFDFCDAITDEPAVLHSGAIGFTTIGASNGHGAIGFTTIGALDRSGAIGYSSAGCTSTGASNGAVLGDAKEVLDLQGAGGSDPNTGPGARHALPMFGRLCHATVSTASHDVAATTINRPTSSTIRSLQTRRLRGVQRRPESRLQQGQWGCPGQEQSLRPRHGARPPKAPLLRPTRQPAAQGRR
mmetsp:Transcript_101095/g.205125  ORF Transcript_101095/g.205125 Transcript_101095/m.205125 type:complete len:272 (+) Transcript_101095:643-1458(+)